MEETFIEKPVGKPLKNFKARVKVYLNKSQKLVVIQTTLACGPTIERELLQLQGDMGKVIGANYAEILKTFNTKPVVEAKLPTDEEIIDRV